MCVTREDNAWGESIAWGVLKTVLLSNSCPVLLRLAANETVENPACPSTLLSKVGINRRMNRRHTTQVHPSLKSSDHPIVFMRQILFLSFLPLILPSGIKSPPASRIKTEFRKPVIRHPIGSSRKKIDSTHGNAVCIFLFFFFFFFFLFIYFSFIPFPLPSPSYPQYIIFAFHHHGVAGHSSASAMIRLRFSPGQKLYKFPGVMCFRWRRAEEQRLMCRKTLLTLTLCKSTSRSILGGSLLPERRGRLSINKWSAMYRGGRCTITAESGRVLSPP